MTSTLSRRDLLAAMAALGLMPAIPGGEAAAATAGATLGEPKPFSFDALIAAAKARAASPTTRRGRRRRRARQDRL